MSVKLGLHWHKTPMDWILSKLLALEELTDSQVEVAKIYFAGAWPTWLIVPFTLVAVGLIWTAYKKEKAQTSAGYWHFLLCLRSLMAIIALSLFFEPTIQLVRHGTLQNSLVMLFDTSHSMEIEDRRQTDEELNRLARALHGKKASDLSKEQRDKIRSYQRLRACKDSMQAKHADLLPQLRKRFRLEVTQFSDSAEPLMLAEGEKADDEAWLKRLAFSGTTTQLGRALTEVNQAYQGQPVAGVVLFSDGGHNHGDDPITAATKLKDLGIPIYTVGVGLEQARDIEVTHIFVDDVVFSKDKIPVHVRFRSHGFAGRQIPIILRTAEGEELGRVDLAARDGAQEVRFEFSRKEAGSLQLVAEITVDAGELLTENNSRSRTVRVIDDRIKVLFVERDPRWEYRYLKNAILRDYRMDLKILLRRGDESLAKFEDSRFVKEFPQEEKDLFPVYNLMILGNVDADYFSEEQMQLIQRFVSEKGAGLVLIAGEPYNPFTYRNTPLENLFPVEIQPYQPRGKDAEIFEPLTQPFLMNLTDDGKVHPMMSLHFDALENQTLWARLPGMFWFAQVGKRRPAALVLAEHASERNDDGPYPLIATQRYGKGSVLYVGVDATWRWRFKRGDELYYRFWNQAIKHLGMPHLLGEASLAQVSTERRAYSVGETVKVYARIMDASYQPLKKESVPAVLSQHGAPVTRLTLSQVPGKGGMYEGQFTASDQGDFNLEIQEGDIRSQTELTVTAPQLELNNPALNRDLLQKLAQATGGKYYEIDQLAQLPKDIKAEEKKTTIRNEEELWDTWLIVLLFASLATVEWVVRKWNNLS
ncbi:MAG: VWA domain-containing protein [Planctomycetota bacterium]|jgi:uncharacterized membrane protein|nr:VWA domain-containing protein [Planctomycetota bacterium]